MVTNRSLSPTTTVTAFCTLSHIYTMQTWSTVLGKRGHQYSSSAPNSLKQLQTPDNTLNPKRAQTAAIVIDGDSNKENIPPFNISPIHIAAMPTSNLMELTPPPSPPASLLPIQARVCALLCSTCNNTSSSIAGHDMEHTALLQFLTSFIDGTSIDHDTHTTSILDHVTPNSQRSHLQKMYKSFISHYILLHSFRTSSSLV